MEAKFEVTNVRKPLMAVARVVDAGNVVQFGPRPEDNFIMPVGSNTKGVLASERYQFRLEGRIDRGSFLTARCWHKAKESVYSLQCSKNVGTCPQLAS